MLLQNLSFMEELVIHPLLVICLQLLLTTKIYRVFVRNLQFSLMFFFLIECKQIELFRTHIRFSRTVLHKLAQRTTMCKQQIKCSKCI
jgi:hypothetical protein